MVERQLAPLVGWNSVEGEFAEALAVQGFDVPALGGKHPTDLVIFALDQRELGDARLANDERGRSARRLLAFELEGAGGEEGDERGIEIAFDGGAVDFVDLMLGGGKAMDELRLVSEQDRATGILVETADGSDHGIAGAPTSGQQIVDRRTLAQFVRADEAEGFVQEEQQAIGVVEGFAVDQDLGGVSLGGGIFGGDAVDGDPTIGDPVTSIAAGAVAKIGEKLIKTTHHKRSGSDTRGMTGDKTRIGDRFFCDLRDIE
jgi:hypothetical protein